MTRALIAVGVCALVLSARATHAAPADEAAIRQASAGYEAAFNKQDLDGMMAVWATDALYTDDAGQTHRGRDAISALFKQSLPEHKGSQIKLRIKSLDFIRPDVAIEEGELQLTDKDGNITRGDYSSVWTKSEGQWRVSSVRDLSQMTPAEPSTSYDHLKELEWMVGHWEREDKSPIVNIDCRWTFSKTFLEQTIHVKDPNSDEEFVVTQFIGWDPVNEQIRSWLFDSRGGFGEGFWTRDGNTWTIPTTGVLQDGGIATSTMIWQYVDDETSIWKAINRQWDGHPSPDVEVKYVRKPAAAAVQAASAATTR